MAKRSNRPTITLRALTCVPHLVEHFAPIKLSKITPEWWKKTPLTFTPDPVRPPQPPPPLPPSPTLSRTAKHCYALQELFAKAIVLRLWADYVVGVGPDGKTWAHSPQATRPGEQHPPSQYPGMLKGWAHYKFICPWLLFTEEPVQFYFTHPFYHRTDPGQFQVMPGITEFHWQNHAHTNCVFPVRNQIAEYEFEVGSPIAYLLPLADVDVVVKAEEIASAEYERLVSGRRLSFHHHKLYQGLDLTLDKRRNRGRHSWISRLMDMHTSLRCPWAKPESQAAQGKQQLPSAVPRRYGAAQDPTVGE